MDIISKYIIEDHKNNKEELQKFFGNLLLDHNYSIDVDYELSEREEFLRDVFFGYSEIQESYESLCDIEVYVKKFPYENEEVSKVRYLRHNIESFFHEVYILKERLEKYLNIIEKNYKSTNKILEVKKLCDFLDQKVYDSLKSIISVRGEHVHKTRYSDKDIEKLVGLELISAEEDWLKERFKIQYKKIKDKWTQKIKKINKQLKKLLDSYFEELHILIFDNKSLIYPSNL